MELFKKAIGVNEDKLVDEIVMEPLWTCLLSRNVLLARLINSCKSEVIHVTVTVLDHLIL